MPIRFYAWRFFESPSMAHQPACICMGQAIAKIFGTLRRAKRDYAHRKDYCFYRTRAKILLLVFAGKIRGFYKTQDRPPISSPRLNPGGQTEILFDWKMPVFLGGGESEDFVISCQNAPFYSLSRRVRIFTLVCPQPLDVSRLRLVCWADLPTVRAPRFWMRLLPYAI